MRYNPRKIELKWPRTRVAFGDTVRGGQNHEV